MILEKLTYFWIFQTFIYIVLQSWRNRGIGHVRLMLTEILIALWLSYFQRLDIILAKRLESYTEFRRMIAVRAKYFFIVLLANRQYTGKMSFNHKNETLEMTVSWYQLVAGTAWILPFTFCFDILLIYISKFLTCCYSNLILHF